MPKIERKFIVIYDVATMLDGLSLEEAISKLQSLDIEQYDSTKMEHEEIWDSDKNQYDNLLGLAGFKLETDDQQVIRERKDAARMERLRNKDRALYEQLKKQFGD